VTFTEFDTAPEGVDVHEDEPEPRSGPEPTGADADEQPERIRAVAAAAATRRGTDLRTGVTFGFAGYWRLSKTRGSGPDRSTTWKYPSSLPYLPST
jgi:hypothetical protein